MNYNSIKEQLKFLTGSDHRANVLLSLLAGAKDVRGLQEVMQEDKSKILHYVMPLIREGLVAKYQATYYLTGTGVLKARLLESMVRGLAAIEENRQFWQGHDLRGIPPRLQAKIGMLSACKRIEDDDPAIMTVLVNFIDVVSKAKRIWGVSSIIAPGHVELIDGLLVKGAEVNLILSKSIIGLIEPETIARWSEEANLYEMPDSCKAAFTVTDDLISLGLYLPDGSYDCNQDLICEGPGSVAWGMELWEYYREMAEVVL